ncbi:MAG: DUF4145 domain-containing protein [Novosphingobium sp.]|nr:DUF4145 domain-containing protein [Novosphingobium sp.]
MHDTVFLKSPLTGMERCPHETCGVARPQLDLIHFTYDSTVDVSRGAVVLGWTIYKCTSCRNVVCFRARIPYEKSHEDLGNRLNRSEVEAIRTLPSGSANFQDWPQRAQKYVEQALQAIAAPDGVVMLAGSAVDAMLKEKGYEKGTVYDRIGQAVSDSELTEAMGEWAHSVRLAANSPRHADLDEPHATKEQAESALEFTRALAQYWFVLPARIARGKASAQQTSLPPAGGGDG